MHKKVLLLIDSLGNGGAERQLALLVKYLPPEWERCVVSLGDGPFAEVIRNDGSQVVVLRRVWRFDISPALALWQLVARWRPDVVHSWGWMASAAVGPICRILGIPLIDGTIRMGQLPPRRSLASRLSRKWANLVIANSRAGLDAWGVDSKRGRVVYNGFDPDRLNLCGRDYFSNQPFIVVMTGRMVAAKDWRTYFSAVRRVINVSSFDYRFIAVGDGPDRRMLMDEMADLVGLGVVVFHEPTLEVLGVVRRANLGVLLTNPEIHAEGCSNTILEYMACGVPVICTAGGGNHELVQDGMTGSIVPPANPQVVAEKILWFRANGADAERMGRAGHERLMEDFTVEQMVSSTVDAYQEVVK